MSGLSAYTPATLGDRQEWRDQTASRAADTAYLNSTGRAICVAITATAGNVRAARVADDAAFSVNVCSIANINGSLTQETLFFVVPAGKFYRLDGPVGTIVIWAELA